MRVHVVNFVFSFIYLFLFLYMCVSESKNVSLSYIFVYLHLGLALVTRGKVVDIVNLKFVSSYLQARCLQYEPENVCWEE